MSEQITILLVEDDVLDAERVQRAMEELSPAIFELVHLDNLRAAVRIVKERNFHVVILDLGLPDSDGLSGVEKLIELVPNIPVVVLTGNDDPSLALRAIEIGAEEFLDKNSIDSKRLTQAIRHAAKRKQRSLSLMNVTESGDRENAVQGVHRILEETSASVCSRTEKLKETKLTDEQQDLVGEIEEEARKSVESAKRLMSRATRPNKTERDH